VTSAPAAAHPLVQDRFAAYSLDNRFLLSSIAFLRSKQLQEGAAARIARDGHQPTYIAVLEVRANAISWSRA
jgi:DNA-directed RNA polymerase subunit K/omega